MYSFLKRLFDFSSASILFLLICPLFIVLLILVRIDLGAPVFFTQIRTGKAMRPFKLVKFRSMTNAKNENGELLPDNLRVTRFGRFLRSSSLDELPELLNIIKGDMSVIGPRPLPPKYDSYYTNYEKNRFLVRGGLITPDSVDDSPIISWDKQFQYEAEYALHPSFAKDITILLCVFRILFKRNQSNYGSYIRNPLDVERNNQNVNK